MAKHPYYGPQNEDVKEIARLKGFKPDNQVFLKWINDWTGKIQEPMAQRKGSVKSKRQSARANRNKSVPQPIRILPMNLQELGYENVLEVQQEYFGNFLPQVRRGSFKYKKLGLSAFPGTLVLFQCEGVIIASAKILKEQTVYPTPNKYGFSGELHFDVNTIRVFDPPMLGEVLKKIWPRMGRLGQVKWKLDPIKFKEFESYLTSKKILSRPKTKALHSRNSANWKLPEGGTAEVSLEITYRNPALRKMVLADKGFKCEVCGEDQTERYGETGKSCVEVHHLRPLSKNKKAPRKVTIKDVAVVCANCHRVIHSSGRIPLPIDVARKQVSSS